MKFPKPAFEPFCKCRNRSMALTRGYQNVKMIRHRYSCESVPPIKSLKSRKAGTPGRFIVERLLSLFDTERHEIDGAPF